MVREIKQFQDQASVGCAVTAGWPPLIRLGWLFEVHGACCGVGVGSFESWGRDLFRDIPQIDEIWIREIRRTGWWALSHCRGNSWVVFVVRRIIRSTAHIDENVSSGQWTQFLINKKYWLIISLRTEIYYFQEQFSASTFWRSTNVCSWLLHLI